VRREPAAAEGGGLMARRRGPYDTRFNRRPTLRIFEREDRNGDLYVEWRVGKTRKCFLVTDQNGDKLRVRGEDGNVVERLVTAAKARALEIYQAWKDGRLERGRAAGRTQAEALSIADGLDFVLALPGGKYARRDSRYKEAKRAAELIKFLLRDTEYRTWADVRPATAALLWRRIAELHRDHGRYGPRWAAIVVAFFYAAARWLYANGMIAASAPQPAPGWKSDLKADWEKITGRPVGKPARPRHTPEEMRSIFAHLDDADPRIALAVELFAELRLGQGIRCRRSDLDLSPVGAFGLGRLTVHGNGRKPGTTIDLTPEQRARLDRALGTGGHLEELEREYRETGRDYYLFPKGRLRDGKATRYYDRREEPIDRTAMRELFRELEDQAGIKHQRGRGWYGLRRVATDVTRRHTSDERVRDAMGGWTPGSPVRESVYMDGQDPEVLAEAARVRRFIRGYVETGTENAGADGETIEALIGRLTALAGPTGLSSDDLDLILAALGRLAASRHSVTDAGKGA